MKRTVLFDLDGTLAMTSTDDWYDRDYREDHPRMPVVWLARALHRLGFRVVLFSGRKEHKREQTETWLAWHRVPFVALHMRADEDQRNDAIVKRELFDASGIAVDDVLFVVDDRPSVVAMWRALGLRVLDVNRRGAF